MERETFKHRDARPRIEARLKKLNTAVQDLTGEPDDEASLWWILNHPGWTSVADVALLEDSLDATLAMTKTLGAIRQQAAEIIQRA